MGGGGGGVPSTSRVFGYLERSKWEGDELRGGGGGGGSNRTSCKPRKLADLRQSATLFVCFIETLRFFTAEVSNVM